MRCSKPAARELETDPGAVAGAPLIPGNQVELLIDARANFDAWLEAINGARESVLIENYMFGDDEVGRELRAALAERASAGIQVKVIRDWFGCIGESLDSFWKPLRAVGGEVRTYNPFQLASPLGSLSRNHRKLLVVDGTVGFISGVCVSARWLGNPARGIAPWRDTGVAVRGPATHDLALAFAENWALLGEKLPQELQVLRRAPSPAGEVALRVVAALPRSTGLYRLDQLIAAIAHKTLWLTDAYFVGTPAYVQGLCAAARRERLGRNFCENRVRGKACSIKRQGAHGTQKFKHHHPVYPRSKEKRTDQAVV